MMNTMFPNITNSLAATAPAHNVQRPTPASATAPGAASPETIRNGDNAVLRDVTARRDAVLFRTMAIEDTGSRRTVFPDFTRPNHATPTLIAFDNGASLRAQILRSARSPNGGD